ncbi:hypothetical protein LINPERPRIM_LOCUS24733, partial [Linum perenne]
MARVLHIYRDRHQYFQDDDTLRYEICIRCADASESYNFALSHAAATIILKTPILQFIRMSA